MKKSVFFFLFICYSSLIADSTLSKEPQQSAVKDTVSHEVMKLACHAAAKYNELVPKSDLPQQKQVQETSNNILAKMRVRAKECVAKDLSLTAIYTKAHELAVEAGDTQAAHMLKEEIDDSQRAFLHSFVHRNPGVATFLAAGIPFVVGIIFAFIVAKPQPVQPRHPLPQQQSAQPRLPQPQPPGAPQVVPFSGRSYSLGGEGGQANS